MSSVGSRLRDLRERRGVSLEEIARSTRVLHHYLQALEADDFAALPAPVFTKGFIRAYCQALGAEPDEAFALYQRQCSESGEGAKPPVTGERTARAPEPVLDAKKRHEGSGRPEGRGRGAVLVSFVMLVVLGLALFVVTFWLQPPREQRAAAPAGGDRPAPAVRPEVPAAAAVAPDAPGSLGGVTSPYRLVARTSERTWMRVRTEDGRTNEENIPAGETREWVSNRPFVLTIGNAGGVALELNGRRVPPLGARGAVIERLVLPPEGQ